MHGYTHQYDATPNRYTAVSADDYEFWNIVQNTPVAEDTSITWASNRLKAGVKELATKKIVPFAWEMPHYQGSPNAYAATVQQFHTTYQRVVYYTSAGNQMNLDPTDPHRDFAVGQFFPYIIESDYYGQRVLPENLGNIEYDISYIDPTSNVVYTWQDLYTNAQYARIIRDGFASFDAGDEPGWLTTRPVTFSGSALFVNVWAPHGELRAEVLDSAGQVIAPFSLESCAPLATDATRVQVHWAGSPDLAALRGRSVRFRFRLANGALYAFWVSPDDRGHSNGYVGAGGPGFDGQRDV